MEREVFERIVVKEMKYLVSAARRAKLDPPEDAVQDTIAAILETHAYIALNPKRGSVRGYLWQCVRNRAMNNTRRERFEQGLFVSFDSGAYDSEVEEKFELGEPPTLDLNADVAAALAKLPVLERTVAEQMYMGCESAQSLADELGIPVLEVREAARRCREKLRGLLRAYGPHPEGELLRSGG